MATFQRASSGQEATADLINQFIDAWTGVANKGVPLALVVNDATHYAATIQQNDAAGHILRCRNAQGTDVLLVEKSSVLINVPLNVGAGVTVDGITLSTHDHSGGAKGVQISHANLANLAGDDHQQYYNSARHTKAVHDALGIDAATLGGYTAAQFAPWADFKQSATVFASAAWALPSPSTWTDVDSMALSLTLAKTCHVLAFFQANIEAKTGDYTGDLSLRAVLGGTTMETWTQANAEGAVGLFGHWYKTGLTGSVACKVQFMRGSSTPRNMYNRRFSVVVIPVS